MKQVTSENPKYIDEKKRLFSKGFQMFGLGRGLRLMVLASLISAGVLAGSLAGPATAAEAVASVGMNQDQSEALTYLNNIRAKTGLQPLQFSATISKAARLHAVYYNTNHGKLSESAHNETKGMPGFMGMAVFDRLKTSGWSPGKNGYTTGEIMHFEQRESKEAVNGWLNTAYHREIILSHNYSEIGIGLVNGTAVMDFAGPYDPAPIQGGIAVYPYDGMKNVGTGFYGLESPNPLSKFNVTKSGYIISATTQNEMVWHKAQITDGSGAEVPYFEELHNKNTLFLYPKSVLKGNHTYKVSISYEMKGKTGKQQKTWSFTTGAETGSKI
ncbi:CAP domain-containing protein [Paenibacillus sp.]|jgi:uncharacterized protein YkwD|uniref:CAP domain-containing protein n=1 Tax=Paenibacillus sp. TaxID=58172 RepID=UPI00282DC500|nr:CAP domain-containing protein [Paenibacillus sp.]MDR0268206.1 CAP domain-containing protein [Paenibacillus sp.]